MLGTKPRTSHHGSPYQCRQVEKEALLSDLDLLQNDKKRTLELFRKHWGKFGPTGWKNLVS